MAEFNIRSKQVMEDSSDYDAAATAAVAGNDRVQEGGNDCQQGIEHHGRGGVTEYSFGTVH